MRKGNFWKGGAEETWISTIWIWHGYEHFGRLSRGEGEEEEREARGREWTGRKREKETEWEMEILTDRSIGLLACLLVLA